MTQPSPQDDLPPGPWSIDRETSPIDDGEFYIEDADGGVVAHGIKFGNVARAIATIPERMEQINQLAAQLIEAEKYNGWHQQAVLEIERLRAENAEMRAALQKISDWKTDGYEVAVAREALAKVNDPETDADLPTANETEGK